MLLRPYPDRCSIGVAPSFIDNNNIHLINRVLKLNILLHSARYLIVIHGFFQKKAVYKKVVLDWPKPSESFSTRSENLKSSERFLGAHLGVGRGEYSPVLIFYWNFVPYFYSKYPILCPILTCFVPSFHEIITLKQRFEKIWRA